jgi:chaperonin GroEL
MKEKKDRVEDAIYATKAALQEGIVAGGGVALLNASQNIKAESRGEELLLNSIKWPYSVIIENSGLPYIEDKKEGYGMNVVNGELTDMLKAGIIDPVLVTKTALKNAVSVVNTIFSADCVINNVRDYEGN